MKTCFLCLEFVPLKSLVANFCPSTRYEKNTQVFISLEGVALCWVLPTQIAKNSMGALENRIQKEFKGKC